MYLSISRIIFIIVILIALSLNTWKSSSFYHPEYLHFENFFGGSVTFHALFSFLIGLTSVFSFPALARTTGHDLFGIRLLILLLLIVSLEEFSQLFISTRSFSFDDLSTNWIWIILGYFCAKFMKLIVKQ
ncbi:VanZ family protein [Vibrio rotiferianus]|uniref:VanZ family protein n=1 Tax=Vibrio rotiferianus TaxID=190895 RepID=UPI0011109DE0|nr:VanZ family protein [Vibrio rotiferianus]TMX67777.1 antibiotic resistance protein VanZ [Vibrio rotiferianus]